MKYCQIKILSVLFAASLMGCGKKVVPSESSPKLEDPTAAAPAQPSAISQKEEPDNAESGERQRTLLELKQKHPELVLSPDLVAPVAELLKRELEGLHPSDSEFVTRLTTLWNENLDRLSVEDLKSSSDTKVVNGTLLPTEFANKNPVDLSQDTPEAILKGVSYVAAVGREEMLVNLAEERMDALPPSSIDLKVFGILDSAIGEIGPPRKVSPFEKWVPLAKARNPLYRLLALRAARHSTSLAAADLSPEDPTYNRIDGTAKLSFYLGFFDEKDPAILAETVSAVATVPTPEARQAIEKFKATQQERGNASLVETATGALRTQELITRSSR